MFFVQPPAVRGVQTFSCTSDSPMGRPSSRVEVTLECDWSEHTCPDGFKYYYNCVTYESLVSFMSSSIRLATVVSNLCGAIYDSTFENWFLVGEARRVCLV